MFDDVIAFVCFCHTERILLPTAKFLVHLFAEGPPLLVQAEMGEVGKEWVGKHTGQKMQMHEKTVQKCNRCRIFGDTLGGYCPATYIFRSSFQGQHFHCRYYASILNHFKVTELES